MKRLAIATLAALASAHVACTNDATVIETTDVDPASISSTIEVTSNGVGASVQLGWSSSTDTTRSLVVGAGDRLVVRAADAAPRDLSYVEGRYFAYLPTTSQTVTIALMRPAGELAFDVLLPKDFTVEGPPAPVSRSVPMEFKWVADPTRGAALTLLSTCFSLAIERSVAKDTGSFTFYPGDFGQVKTACTFSVAVTRTGSYSASTPFRMNGITRQVRTIRVETTP